MRATLRKPQRGAQRTTLPLQGRHYGEGVGENADDGVTVDVTGGVTVTVTGVGVGVGVGVVGMGRGVGVDRGFGVRVGATYTFVELGTGVDPGLPALGAPEADPGISTVALMEASTG